MTVVGASCYFIFYRYYFFGKIQSNWMDKIPEEKQEKLASINKRNWGYDTHYEPTLDISMRKKIRESLGKDYKLIPKFEFYQVENRTIEEVIEEENNIEF